MPDDRGCCVWCDTPTRHKRGGGKPVGVYGYLTDDQVRALHRVYLGGLSLRQVAARILPRTRYSSVHSCANSLFDHFVRLDLQRRDRISATVAASTVHGLARRGKVDPAHRRRLKIARGEVIGVMCTATVARTGTPCQRAALAGGRFCVGHEPARAGERALILAAARAARGQVVA